VIAYRVQDFSGQAEFAAVHVRDARSLDGKPSLDEQGFALVEMPMADGWFEEMRKAAPRRQRNEKEYYPMVETLLKKTIPGASRVKCLNQVLRSTSRDLPKYGAKGKSMERQPPLPVAHIDYTISIILRGLAEGNFYPAFRTPEGSSSDKKITAQEILNADRVMLVNVWRSLSDEPVQRSPLGVCDARTVSWATSEGFDTGHAWYFFSEMQKNEALIFKQFDSFSAISGAELDDAVKRAVAFRAMAKLRSGEDSKRRGRVLKDVLKLEREFPDFRALLLRSLGDMPSLRKVPPRLHFGIVQAIIILRHWSEFVGVLEKVCEGSILPCGRVKKLCAILGEDELTRSREENELLFTMAEKLKNSSLPSGGEESNRATNQGPVLHGALNFGTDSQLENLPHRSSVEVRALVLIQHEQGGSDA